jgi:hypothetical protein
MWGLALGCAALAMCGALLLMVGALLQMVALWALAWLGALLLGVPKGVAL